MNRTFEEDPKQFNFIVNRRWMTSPKSKRGESTPGKCHAADYNYQTAAASVHEDEDNENVQ